MLPYAGIIQVRYKGTRVYPQTLSCRSPSVLINFL